MVSTALNKINLKINNLIENVEVNKSITDTCSDNRLPESIDQEKNEMEENAIEYLAGWIAKKYRLQFPELGSTTTQCNSVQNIQGHDDTIPTYVNHLSYGGLIVSSLEFKNTTLRIERLFNKITKNKIPKWAGVLKPLTKKKFASNGHRRKI